MKKLWPVILVSLLIISSIPVNAKADTSLDPINKLRFSDIREDIMARNPTVKENGHKLVDGISPIVDSLNYINGMKDNLLTHIGALSAYFTQPGKTGIHLDPVGGGFLDSSNTPMVGNVSIPIIIADPASRASINETLDYVNYNLYRLYQTQLGTLQGQIGALTGQRDNFWKSILQNEMGSDQLVWGTQQMFLSYQGLNLQKVVLKDNRTMVESQVQIMKLREKLGMVTNMDREDLELQLSDLDATIKSLDDAQNTLKGSLNLFLGQDYDIALSVDEVLSPDFDKINAMDYVKDLQTALKYSYIIRLQANEKNDDDKDLKTVNKNNEIIEITDAQTRQVRMDFDKAFKDVKTKRESLTREKAKFDTAQVKWNQLQLKYNLGLIARLEMDAGKKTYDLQASKVTTAEMDLVKSSTAYDWLLEGISVSTTTSTGNTQTPS